MTHTYHVHIDRVMRLTFSPVVADSPEHAAAIARHLPTEDALSIDDCDGPSLAARVERDGDDAPRHPRTIEFLGPRGTRTAAA